MKELKTKWKNRVIFCKPRKTLFQRIIEWIKRK
jgi:hypothetical protein